MAATSQTVSTGSQSTISRRDARPLLWLLSLVCLIPVAWQSIIHASQIRSDLLNLFPWVALIAAANQLPLSVWKRIHFFPNTPIVTAGMLVLQPAEVAIVCFFGAFDPKEFRGKITFTKAVFNRSQLSLCALVGSVASHTFAMRPASSSYVIALAVLSLFVMFTANYVLVGLAVAFDRGYPFRKAVLQLRFGSISDFIVTCSLWAVLGAVLAALYGESRPLAVIAFLAASLLGRQVLMRSQMLVDTASAYRSREQALQQVSRQIAQERFDERKLIAAELHDEALQPLFKVTLMAQVLRGDLASGRLLELDQDLPELLTAAELASSTLRELIGDLRRSALGRGGLGPAMNRLLRMAGERVGARVASDIEAVTVDPDVELVIYQIAKEAVTNAFTHSRAQHIWVTLHQHAGTVELAVRDDGIGFDPTDVPEGHYGLHIMRERAAAAGGELDIESSPNAGCTLRLSVFGTARRRVAT